MVSVQELNIEDDVKRSLLIRVLTLSLILIVKRSRDAVLDRLAYTANESCRSSADRDVEHSSSKCIISLQHVRILEAKVREVTDFTGSSQNFRDLKGLAGRLECQ
nr:hypothetical protein [Tanacetum cinerariifolium]